MMLSTGIGNVGLIGLMWFDIDPEIFHKGSDMIVYLIPRIVRDIDAKKISAAQTTYTGRDKSAEISIIPIIGGMKSFQFYDGKDKQNKDTLNELREFLGWKV